MRARATEWGVDPAVWGSWVFGRWTSTSTAATHFDEGNEAASDPLDRPGCRPDFAIMAYPVITLVGEYAHGGSRKNLLGDDPDPSLVESLSNQTQVTDRTPPTFLFHTGTHTAVPPENSVLFYHACALRKCRPRCTSTKRAGTA